MTLLKMRKESFLLEFNRDLFYFIIFSHDSTAPVGLTVSLLRFRAHTETHHTRQDSSGRVISPSRRILQDICICCTLCVFVVLCVYCCSYFRCRTAGWKSVSGRSCDQPPRHRFSLVSLSLQANAEMVPQFPSCYYMPLMQPSRLTFSSYFFFIFVCM